MLERGRDRECEREGRAIERTRGKKRDRMLKRGRDTESERS